MSATRSQRLSPKLLAKVFGFAFFAYLFLGFMLLPWPACSTPSTPPESGTPWR